jgi:hypothetical protein
MEKMEKKMEKMEKDFYKMMKIMETDEGVDELVREMAFNLPFHNNRDKLRDNVCLAMACLAPHIAKPQPSNGEWVRNKIIDADYHCWIELENGKILDYPENILRDNFKNMMEKRYGMPQRVINNGIMKYVSWVDSAGNNAGIIIPERWGEDLKKEIKKKGKKETTLKYMDTRQCNGTRRCGQRTALIGMGLEEKGIKFKYCMGSLGIIDPKTGVAMWIYG